MKSHKRAFLLGTATHGHIFEIPKLCFRTNECQRLNLAEPPRGFFQCFRGKNFVLFRDQSPEFFSLTIKGLLSEVAKIHFNQ